MRYHAMQGESLPELLAPFLLIFFCVFFVMFKNQLESNGHPSKNTGKRNMRLCRLSSLESSPVLEKSAVVAPVVVSLLARHYQNNSQV